MIYRSLCLVFSFLLLTLFLWQCASTPTITPEKILTADEMLKKGQGFLTAAKPYDFFHFLTLNQKRFPVQTSVLLSNYAASENELVQTAISNKDLVSSKLHLKNLECVYDWENNEDFLGTLEPLTHSLTLEASKKYYAMITGNDKPEDFEKPSSPISFYRKFLVRIDVHREYLSRTKLTRKSHSFGSGIFINSNRILTAYHVVSDIFYTNSLKSEIEITDSKSNSYFAKLLAWDSLTDLCVLELKQGFFPETPNLIPYFANSKKVKPGDVIYCLGNHYGYNDSLTRGIVSSSARQAPEVGQWIQVDAAVSPGASGGVAIGGDGLIYGIIDAGYIYQDINFIVPSITVMEVLDNLQKGENIRRPWLGLLLEDSKTNGILIREIFPSSPLNTYLSLTNRPLKLESLNGLKLRSIELAQTYIASGMPDNFVRLTTLDAKGNTNQFFLPLMRRPDLPIYNAEKDKNSFSSLYPYFGFEIQTSASKTMTSGTRKLQLFPVSVIDNNSRLYDLGVRVGHYRISRKIEGEHILSPSTINHRESI